MAVAAVAAVLLVPAALSAAPRTLSTAALDVGVLREMNATRAQHGLPALRLNLRLSDAAAAHTQEMGVDGYFTHNSFDGTPFWKRITQFYDVDGYGSWSVGENLLWASPDVDPAQALRWWMASPPHRANILSPAWRDVGIDAETVPGAPGTYHGLEVTIITVDFGVRR